jgi:arsenate reductase
MNALGPSPAQQATLRAQLAAWRAANPDQPGGLAFVCTHNARRSQLAHALAYSLILASGQPWQRLTVQSAGSEPIAAVPEPVMATLLAAGFRAVAEANGAPGRTIRAGAMGPAVTLAPKPLDALQLPITFALMVCAEADAACPAVPGAQHRLVLPFADPGQAAGEPAAAHDTCRDAIAQVLQYVLAPLLMPHPQSIEPN